MKKIYWVIFLLVSIQWGWSTYFPRLVLVEEATNASCGPCAANNPIFQDFYSRHFGGMITVRYHAWWPGSDDPMYQANTMDNRTRINYYHISGVPHYVMDGIYEGNPGNVEEMHNQLWDRLLQPSPVKIQVATRMDSTSLHIKVSIFVGDSVPAGNWKLRIAIIERLIEYNTPPGANGEKVFPDVMRKMVPIADGTAISNFPVGDTLHFQFTEQIHNGWNRERLAVVAWLQNDDSKEVLQAGTNLPVFFIKRGQPELRLFQANQSLEHSYAIVNTNIDSLAIKIFLRSIQTIDWTATLKQNGQPVDTITAVLAPGDSLNFSILASATNTGYMNATVLAQNLSDPNHFDYGFEVTFKGMIPDAPVLFVDDDGGASFENRYFEIFQQMGQNFTVVQEGDVEGLSNQYALTHYSMIFWNVSWGFPALTRSDVQLLMDYLDQGGRLFIAGQDIGWDIHDAYGSSNFRKAHIFYNEYLGSHYDADNSQVYSLEGVPGDPIGDSLQFSLNNVYSLFPEVISTYTDSAVGFIRYSGTNKFAAIRNTNGNFRTVYLGFGLEQMDSAEMQENLISRSIAWLSLPTGIRSTGPAVVKKLALYQNYPNPFNPSTTITFQLPRAMQVELTIFNLLGQPVRHLLQEKRPEGSYRVKWDGTDDYGHPLPSGIYFYRLKTPSGQMQRKMILLR